MTTETIEILTALADASKNFDWAKQTGKTQNDLIRAIHLAVVHGGDLKRSLRNDSPVRFKVAGRGGTFPFDQLRHDHAWPATSDDAALLTYVPGGGNVAIELVAQSRRAITPARWASFGWTVVEIDGEEVAHG